MSVRRPCPSCPWRVDQDATAIPNFNLDLAEELWRTCRRTGYGQEFGDPQFACHQSRDGDEIVCAGWLAMQGSSHPAVRIAVMTGALDPDALAPGPDWPELHEEFDDVIEKLRLTA